MQREGEYAEMGGGGERKGGGIQKQYSESCVPYKEEVILLSFKLQKTAMNKCKH